MKIFIVEYNDVIREELKVIFCKYDYEVTTTTDFENIMDNLEKESLDLNFVGY